MKKALLIIGVSILGLAAFGGIAYGTNQAFATTETETTRVSEHVKAIALDVDTGDVELVRGSGAVTIEQTSEYLVSEPDVERSVENGVLTIKSDCGGLFLLDCTTDFRIEVPQGVAVTVKTDVGDVTGTALASSDVRVKTDVGDVDVDLTTAPNRLEAITDVGEVEIGLPDAVYAVDTDTDVGEIDVEGVVQDDRAPRSVTAKTDVGDVTIQGR
jgi:Putative adhesin